MIPFGYAGPGIGRDYHNTASMIFAKYQSGGFLDQQGFFQFTSEFCLNVGRPVPNPMLLKSHWNNTSGLGMNLIDMKSFVDRIMSGLL